VTDSATFTTSEAGDEDLRDLLLQVLPGDGSTIGNLSAREALSRAAGRQISEEEYEEVKEKALTLGLVVKGRGRGGSIGLADGIPGGSRYEGNSAPRSPRSTGEDGIAQEPTLRSSQKLTLTDVEKKFWEIANILRAGTDNAEYRSLIFRLIFLKRLSDVFDEAREEVKSRYQIEGRTLKEAEECTENPSEYIKTFFVPKRARWERIINQIEELGIALKQANASLEKEHKILKGVLTEVDYEQIHRNAEASLRDAVCCLSQLRLNEKNFEQSDTFNTAWKNLQALLVDQEGRRGGEYYTPTEVARLLTQLANAKEGMSFYDPACGLGGILLEAHRDTTAKGKITKTIRLRGQEVNSNTYRMAKLNLIAEGIEEFDIRHGNTLTDPQHLIDGQIEKFDRIASSPPFGLSNWGHDQAHKDPYKRFVYGIPPKESGDFAFIEHMLATIKDDGVICTVVTNGILLRGGVEGKIRKEMVDRDCIETVISLPPCLYSGTGIPVSIVIFNKNKNSDRRRKTLFIDASHDCEYGRTRNMLRDIDIQKIVSCHEKYEDELPYAKKVDIEEIISNNYSLIVKKYADCSPEKLQAKRLLAQYKDYRMMSLMEMTIKVGQVRAGESFEERENSIFVPKAGIHRCSASLSRFHAKHHNAFQLELNPKLILAEYLEIFLQSELGKLTLKGITYGSFLPMLRWEGQLSDAEIPVPTIKSQNRIIEASNRLETLKGCIEDLEQNLALSPLSTNGVLAQTESMLSAVGGLTDADRVISQVRQGESGQCEFKESFGLDLRKGTHEKYIEISSLKTIVAFLNTDGGTLLVGVADEGGIPGLTREIEMLHKGKTDRFLLHFKNQLKSKIGEEFYPFIKHKIVAIGESEVLTVEVSRSPKACYLDGKDFYVRTNPATDKLEGPKLVEYVLNHFS